MFHNSDVDCAGQVHNSVNRLDCTCRKTTLYVCGTYVQEMETAMSDAGRVFTYFPVQI